MGSAPVVVIWAQRFETTGSVAAKPSGGSTSPLEKHAEFLLALIAKQPDLTLDEIVAAMNKRGIPGSRSFANVSVVWLGKRRPEAMPLRDHRPNKIAAA